MTIDWLIALALAFPIPIPNTPSNQEALDAFLHRHDIGDDWNGTLYSLPWLRERVHHILPAPPSIDCDRLPSVRWLNDQLTFNERFHRHVEALLAHDLHREHELLELRATTEFLGRYYRAALMAATARSSYHRRDWLLEMRNLSPVWYHSGLFPPSVPVWAFKEVDR